MPADRSVRAASLGLDFGTTNTVATWLGPDGAVRPLAFPESDGGNDIYRSALNFWTDGRGGRLEHFDAAGPNAVARLVAAPEGCRFLQSFKTFAASPSFRNTIVHGRSYKFEDLLATFLRHMATARRDGPDPLPRRLIAGRPVAFAGAAPDPALAETRYDAAFRAAGFDEIHYVHEPVAAAFWFARGLKKDATVLVADFGGGTSDFSVVRFTVDARGVHAHPLAQTGVGIAGDSFDFRILDRVVAPHLGKGGRYKSFGKWLDLPSHYYADFARWNRLAVMKTGETLKELERLAAAAEDPTGLERLIEVIEEDLGYPLYRAVSDVKTALSHADEAKLTFRHRDIAIEEKVSRADFEGWIADDLEKIRLSFEEALTRAGLDAKDVDRVFLTGGTSFVPAVRRLFEDRFGTERLETGDQLLSIAYGLALIGAEEDIGRWTVRETKAAA